MLIHLTEIFSSDTSEAKLSKSISVDHVTIDRVNFPFLEPILVEVSLKKISLTEILAEGKIKTSIEIPCGRCTVSVPYVLEADFSKAIMLENDADEEHEIYVVGNHLNLEELVLNEIYLNFPMKVLCQEDCKGICNQCGADLNVESCQCEDDNIDPRLAVLKDLMDSKFKEV